MSVTPGYAAWKLAFQASPIILTNGILSSLPGGMLPIIAITEAINFPIGLLTSGNNIGLDKFFANFVVIPGSTVISQDLGRYPFANQKVAANAVISQPLMVAYRMIAPAQERFGMFTKLAIMTALIETLKMHNAAGGTYICVTPSYIYTNCVMREMRDSSSGYTKQPQDVWELMFEKPLITLADAESAQNGLMSLMSSGGQIPGNPSEVAWSGLGTGGALQPSISGPSVISAGQGSLAANTAGSSGLVSQAFNAPTGTTVTAGGSFGTSPAGPLGGGGV